MGLWLAARPAASAGCNLEKIAEMPVTMEGLRPVVMVKINGVEGRLILDTGAFFSMVTPTAAQRFGLRPQALPYGLTITGATGAAPARYADAENFTVLGAPFRHVEFLVTAPGIAAEGYDGLLGRNFLSFADVEFDLANGMVRFFDEHGECRGAALAYWTTSDSYALVALTPVVPPDTEIRGDAALNGVRVRALFDSGAPVSALTRQAAQKSGVNSGSLGVEPAGPAGGIGPRIIESWIGRFETFELGGETITKPRLEFGQFEYGGADMLIGADFFLSHRIFISKSQRRMFFTYNGGPVFHLDPVRGPQPDAADAIAAPGAPSSTPTDAEGFIRRGQAFASRRDFRAALADFDQAIHLEPDVATHYLARAKARMEMGDDEAAALADLDSAVRLKPDDVRIRLQRGVLRLRSKDDPGAREDFDAAVHADPTQRGAVAGAYISTDHLQEAVAELEPAPPASASADLRAAYLNERCWARALWGRELDQALADCNEALRLAPRTGEILDSRGLVHLRRGETEAAIADYTAALRARPQTSWSLYGRGLAERAKGLGAQADADFAAAVALEADLPERFQHYGITPTPEASAPPLAASSPSPPAP